MSTEENKFQSAWNSVVGVTGDEPSEAIKRYLSNPEFVEEDLMEVVETLTSKEDLDVPVSLIMMFFTGVLYALDHPMDTGDLDISRIDSEYRN